MAEATESIVTATTDERIVHEGFKCKFLGWDKDGDALLLLEEMKIVIFRDDLDKFSLA